ncbi:MAG: enoyl-CoA hydratase/isomerase family protein [Alphaproteobacteria bacterium]|nr:enoyl-CoA hydratase/isomerase family protein [Alphaproteobacteria bacterium]MDE2042740.1 enoyl-CoA hydratase/isomerase family protein [Alphaproteobacteria bacterium]MDE2339993.1 enoyl-CoA hydratase/isomerase family protein [Alphaproteobacteria bacterium]
MTDAPLLVEVQDNILIATLNRPDKLNAINCEMMELLTDAVLRFRDTHELKVMLIRATGRYFSAGADMKNPADQKKLSPTRYTASGIRENHRLNLNNMQQLWDEMEHIEKPFVVAHQAMCVGGGLELSLSCDFRLAAQSAGYAFPEGLFGVLPASSGVSRLTRFCGPHWARWLIMANKPATASLALTMGLVHQVYPDETFEADIMDFCHHLAKQNGEQMGAAKVAIDLCAELGRDSARHVERMANSGLMLNPEYLKQVEEYTKGIGGKKGA